MKTAKDAPKGMTPDQAARWAAGWNAAATSCARCAGVRK